MQTKCTQYGVPTCPPPTHLPHTHTHTPTPTHALPPTHTHPRTHTHTHTTQNTHSPSLPLCPPARCRQGLSRGRLSPAQPASSSLFLCVPLSRARCSSPQPASAIRTKPRGSRQMFQVLLSLLKRTQPGQPREPQHTRSPRMRRCAKAKTMLLRTVPCRKSRRHSSSNPGGQPRPAQCLSHRPAACTSRSIYRYCAGQGRREALGSEQPEQCDARGRGEGGLSARCKPVSPSPSRPPPPFSARRGRQAARGVYAPERPAAEARR